jgi:DNA-binding CsgD family transcriptional regulator
MACLQDVHFTKGKRKGEVLNPFEQAKRAVNSARIRATDARTRDKRRLFRLPGNDRPVLDPAGEDPMHVAMREETLGSLTDVERSLLTLLQQGYSDREIARGSKVDEVQIAEYRRSIREKLAAAVARDDQALPAGYVPPGTRAAPKGSSNDAEHGGNAPGLARLLRGVLPAAAAELQEAREAD